MNGLNVPLTGIAVALSGATAASVGMAIYHLIPDKLLGGMFAGAAVLLDVYKYLSWPAADRLAEQGRGVLAALMITCAVVLAVVSGWATYDRLQGSLAAAEAPDGLEDELARARQRVANLDAEVAAVRRQAEYLRSRGMATPALSLEGQALDRLDGLRAEAQGRVDQAAEGIAARPPRAALAPAVAMLLCLGFALALELVPVLIFLGVRRRASVPASEPVPEPLYAAGSEAGAAVEVVTPELPQLPPEPAPEPVQNQAPKPTEEHLREPPPVEILEPVLVPAPEPAAHADDEDLLQKLLDEVAGVEPGTSMPIKKFARAAGIGNSKAGDIFQAAADRGVITKTTRGYVAA